jgi:hypothetical protein
MIKILRRAYAYWQKNGTKLLMNAIYRRILSRKEKYSHEVVFSDTAHLPPFSPLPLYGLRRVGLPRISLVTDSVNQGSLFGGVGTSLILALLLAEDRGARLRIITRTESVNSDALFKFLSLYKYDLNSEIEFSFCPSNRESRSVDAFDDEIFITTSWWTTGSTVSSVPLSRVIYLLQEDERMFYNHGVEHLRCSQLLSLDNLVTIVNTGILYQHLVNSGLSRLLQHGWSFEPSFPSNIYYPRSRTDGGKRQFVFYARPGHPRNLYEFGVDLIRKAVDLGIINLLDWDIIFVGCNSTHVTFNDGRCQPKVYNGLSWEDYAILAGSVDLALCLMYTPHPSYPPMDFAASGAVVVTNRYGVKTDLALYSENILCGDLTMDSMLDAITAGIQLALDEEERTRRCVSNKMSTDWRESFADTLSRLRSATHV